MKRFACDKKTEAECLKCGRCCTIREDENMDFDSDEKLRRYLYNMYGIVYVFPLDRYALGLSDFERKIYLRVAKKHKIKINILPKKIVIENDKAKVVDWFLDHDICPFLGNDKLCTMYATRSKICKSFPKLIEIKPSYYKKDHDFDSALKIANEHMEKYVGKIKVN